MAQFVKLGIYTVNLDAIAFIDWEFPSVGNTVTGMKIVFLSNVGTSGEKDDFLWISNNDPDVQAFKTSLSKSL